VVDADGPANREDVFKRVDVHIAKEIKSKVDVIILDYELEEWICYSFGIHFAGDKPSKALNERCKGKRGSKKGYKKWQLPKFVENLDINALRRNCRSFEEFVSMLLVGKMGKEIKIWYDSEGDYLEVIFERKAGYFRETENDAVMEKVDEEGNIIGFSILKVSALKEREPISVSLQ
jgi:uncharacterized protein YuzE